MREFSLTVTSKGQVTLPASYRQLARITTGAKLKLMVDESGDARLKRALTIDDIAGSLGHLVQDRPLTDRDVADAVDETMRDKEARSRGL